MISYFNYGCAGTRSENKLYMFKKIIVNYFGRTQQTVELVILQLRELKKKHFGL